MSLEKYVDILENKIKKLPENGGKHIHIGCGAAIYHGFSNIDAYFEHPDVIKSDFSSGLMFDDSSLDSIYSSHSLEHIPHRKVPFVIDEGFRALKSGGKFYLAVPDLEVICYRILDPNTPEEYMEWFYYCLFGYQINSNYPSNIANSHLLPVDHGQFHTTGFTEKRLRKLFANWQITEMFKYDGWGTPSIYLEATRP